MLKPGGRLAISDVVNIAPLPPISRTTLRCCAAASPAPRRRGRGLLPTTGFVDVRVAVKPESRELIASWAPGRGIENYVASAAIEARKPTTRSTTSSFSAPAIRRAASWPRSCSITGARGASRATAPAAFRRQGSPAGAEAAARAPAADGTCAARAGTSSPRPARRSWTSSSPSATRRPARCAQSGRASP